MLSKEDIERNKQEFISLIYSIEREFNKDRLIEWLENKSDFFTAPASSKHHGSYEGGLCDHSLNVYYSLKSIALSFLSYDLDQEGNAHFKYSEDTFKIVGLLHDISKANYYEKYYRNVKDEKGNWVQVPDYKVREDRFIFGSKEQTAEFMISNFIPLTVEERIAILHSSGGQAYDSTQTNIGTIFGKSNLATLLHTADLLSTFVLENDKR